ncbi:adenylosuccinate lyase [Phototrophicus methaneseepsis]|uniref:Adenylosuccinate lyase n=1 Tax=Phototrophicus methaneseepsis TaxID=2710758 RepID=A0A7S8E6S7_9CHLR|nr:adenylosuccinate lyase [Phototrophicus methaneseepsis]QPC81397.1 adenylosuccinate lyase [Phototrophicus methaneseepsis]
MSQFSYETYLSPFTWRYGSDEMRYIWSLANKRRLWRKVWVALAAAQHDAGLVTTAQLDDLRTYEDAVDIERAHEYEQELHHDLMAEIRVFAEQAKIGGGIIHLGATSMDVEDNADVLRIRDAMDVIIQKTEATLGALAELIEREADHVCMAFTHIQPAEPTTIGYRLAFVAQDLLADYQTLRQVRVSLRGKGIKGAVGTSASYTELLRETPLSPRQMETLVMQNLSLEAFEIANQTYPRRQDWDVVNALAGLGMTLYKFALDLRLLQSPPIGEWGEPFGRHQVGSSAMPFKRNPINAENMDSMARYLAALPRVTWDNAAHSMLERTLDDSGNRRLVLPDAFLTADELLRRMQRLVTGLRINEAAIQRNLDTYGVFAATERLLMEAVRTGGDRQVLHEVIREHSMVAWAAIMQGDSNNLADLLATDARITQYMAPETVRALLDATEHIGDAPERARNLVSSIRQALPQGTS